MNTLKTQILLLEMKKALIHMDHCNIVATRENNLGGWLGDHTSIMSQYEADYNEAKKALELMESQSLVTKSVSSPDLTGTTLAYAQAGDARRQNEMGNMCYFGDGMPEDKEQAYEWWLKAAEKGNYEAQMSLVNAYRKGEGVEKNLRAADYWLEQAGRQPAKNAQ